MLQTAVQISARNHTWRNRTQKEHDTMCGQLTCLEYLIRGQHDYLIIMTKKIALISSKTRDSMVGKGSDQGGEQFTQVSFTSNM